MWGYIICQTQHISRQTLISIQTMAWNISNIENWHRNSLSTLITACSPCPKTWSPFEEKPFLFSRFCCGEIGSILWNWDKIQECQVWRPSYTLGDTLQSPFKPLFLKLLLNSHLTNPPHTKSKFFLCLQYIPAHIQKKKERAKKMLGMGCLLFLVPCSPKYSFLAEGSLCVQQMAQLQ